MIVLLAPESRFISGGYLYNQGITDSLPREQFEYRRLPMEPDNTAQNRPPAPVALPSFGVDPDAHLLLDSLYFAHPRWVESLANSHPGPLSMLVHYLPSREPLLPPAVAEAKHRDEEACLACCRSAVVPSRYLKAEIQRRHSKTLPITVAAPGIVPAPTPGNLVDETQAAVQLLTVANWTASKNHRFLLPILAKLSNLPWKWSIYGRADKTGALVQEFRRIAQELQIEARIHIGPPLPPKEVMSTMHRADLFIYPSLFESYGMVLAEALAAGLPIIANRIGGIPEVVEGSPLKNDSPAGAILCNFKTPPGSQTEWQSALDRLIQHPQERQNLGTAALERARSLPTWHTTADTILSHLEPK